MFQGDLISNSGRKKIHLGLSVTAMIDCALLVHNEYIYSDTSNIFWQKSAQSLEMGIPFIPVKNAGILLV